MLPVESGSRAGREPSDEDEDADEGNQYGGREGDALFFSVISTRWWSCFFLSMSTVTRLK